MIIEEVRIHNLFSYCGEQVFDFRGLQPGRNIALVYGRNGYGKTSFLNALRLLFLGASDEMRGAVQAGRKPSPKQYVLGIPGEWSGIFNRAARKAGETECSVTLVFRESEGSVSARRWWKLVGENDYDDGLAVQPEGESVPLGGQAASELLYYRIPRYLVPFFIFDGEQVQQLAEVNRKGQLEQIEQVLGLSGLDRQIETLTALIKGWKKEGMPAEVAQAMRDLERQQEAQEDRLAETRTKLEESREEVSCAERELPELERYLESLRAFSREKEGAILKDRADKIRVELSELLAKLAKELPRDIPLLSNPALVQRASNLLRQLVEDSAGEVAKTLAQILDQLPRRLLDDWPLPSPDITPAQKHFQRQKLTDLLKPYLAPPTSGSGPLHIGREKASELLALFQFYERAEQLRMQRAEELRAISALKREQEELERKLDDVSSLQEDERRRYLERKAEKQKLEDEVRILKDALHDLERDERECLRKIGAISEEIKKQEKTLRLSQERQTKVDTGERFKAFSESYKQKLKLHHRAAIEEAINRHFRVLMTGHRLLDRVVVAEDFGLHYLDASGAQIGLGTISAGMKQLVATALLWALREVSGTSAPVVIDTPLARIDRENQLNLINRYYPNAAEQVILLPTDSELDAEKFALLAPRIYRQYRLDNPSGESTQPVRDAAMYEVQEA